jgi:xylulokinase
MVRSILEGITFAMRDLLEILKSLGIPVDVIRCAGGGSESQSWLQLQADVFNEKVEKNGIKNHSALGACLLAGSGIGLFPVNPEILVESLHSASSVYTPDKKKVLVYEKCYRRFKCLYEVLKDRF